MPSAVQSPDSNRSGITNALHSLSKHNSFQRSWNHSKGGCLFVLIGNYFFTLPYYQFNRGLNIRCSASRGRRKQAQLPKRFFFRAYHAYSPIGIKQLDQLRFSRFLREIRQQSLSAGITSPFQPGSRIHEYCGIGIAGVIAFKASLPFRFATFIPPAVFSLGAAGGISIR